MVAEVASSLSFPLPNPRLTAEDGPEEVAAAVVVLGLCVLAAAFFN